MPASYKRGAGGGLSIFQLFAVPARTGRWAVRRRRRTVGSASPCYPSECGLEGGDALHFAICGSVQEGVTYVAAAGSGTENFKSSAPAAHDEILTVTAMTDTDGDPGAMAGIPPAGRTSATIQGSSSATSRPSAATTRSTPPPRACVTVRPTQEIPTLSVPGRASPLVAGTAALYKARHPDATPARVIELIRTQAREEPARYGFDGDPRSPLRSRYYGYLVYAGDF